MKPHSIDLRRRIVESYEAGEGSICQLAKRYKVGPDAVCRLLKRYRETGSVKPLPQGGSKAPKLSSSHLDVLQTLVEEDNDATLAQWTDRLEKRTQLKVSRSTISRELSHLEITRKKSLKASKAYTDEVQQQRRDYWEQAGQIKVSDLVFLDETGFNRVMVTLYARALRGQRTYGPKPSKGKNISVIGALTLTAGFIAGFRFEGGTNGDTFLWYVEHVLVPNLWPGAVVVMDNLSAHKVDGVVDAIERAGARVLYLSPYSPDFNPIEHVWSKVKQHVQAVESSTKETLHKAIQSGLELIILEDVRNWFCHCCYGTG